MTWSPRNRCGEDDDDDDMGEDAPLNGETQSSRLSTPISPDLSQNGRISHPFDKPHLNGHSSGIDSNSDEGLNYSNIGGEVSRSILNKDSGDKSERKSPGKITTIYLLIYQLSRLRKRFANKNGGLLLVKVMRNLQQIIIYFFWLIIISYKQGATKLFQKQKFNESTVSTLFLFQNNTNSKLPPIFMNNFVLQIRFNIILREFCMELKLCCWCSYSKYLHINIVADMAY